MTIKSAITRAQIDELTPEERQVIRDWWQPCKNDKFWSGKSKRVYTVKTVYKNGDLKSGSFRVGKSKCLPVMDSVMMWDMWRSRQADIDGTVEIALADELVDFMWNQLNISIRYGGGKKDA